MGVSTDAILFYGYCWDVESSRPWAIGEDVEDDDDESSSDWEARYAEACGLNEPTSEYPDLKCYDGKGRVRYNTGFRVLEREPTPDEQAIIDSYRSYWKASRDLVQNSGCIVGSHCHSDCPMPYVAVKASVITSSRGEMTEITSLEIQSNWNEKLEDFCQKLGIKTEGLKAAWWLVSDWS